MRVFASLLVASCLAVPFGCDKPKKSSQGTPKEDPRQVVPVGGTTQDPVTDTGDPKIAPMPRPGKTDTNVNPMPMVEPKPVPVEPKPKPMVEPKPAPVEPKPKPMLEPKPVPVEPKPMVEPKPKVKPEPVEPEPKVTPVPKSTLEVAPAPRMKM